MPRSPPANISRSFKTRTDGIFKKASELHDIDGSIRITIVIERPGQRPMIFSTERRAAWPCDTMEEYVGVLSTHELKKKTKLSRFEIVKQCSSGQHNSKALSTVCQKVTFRWLRGKLLRRHRYRTCRAHCRAHRRAHLNQIIIRWTDQKGFFCLLHHSYNATVGLLVHCLMLRIWYSLQNGSCEQDHKS
jgi:hypothetical protein